MKIEMHTRYILLIVLLFIASSHTVHADVEWKFSGQVRARWELDRKSFSGSTKPNEFGLLRTRLGVAAKVNDNVSAFVQLQDSRTIGGVINSQQTSGTTNDARNIDLHQGFFVINHLWNRGPGMKAGRFEVNIGNERFFGGGNWSNIGRSFEGISLFSTSETFSPSLMYLKLVESQATLNYSNEVSILLLHLAFPNITTDLVLLADIDNRNTSISSFLERRYHFGLYTKRPLGGFLFEGNGAFQLGEVATTGGVLDIAAFLAAMQLGRQFDPDNKGLFALGIDWSSGDDFDSNDKYERYDDLYFTGHKFRGFIDIVDQPAAQGMLDAYLRLIAPMNAANNFTLQLDAHTFFLSPNAIPSGESLTDSNYGVEFDLVNTITSIAGAKLELGASIFLPGNLYGDNLDPAYWGYGAVVVDF